MIRVYRITRHKYKDSILDGIGAAKYGGRWNKPGIPVIYSSESRALAVLETLVNVRNIGYMPKDYIMLTLEINTDVISLPVQSLSNDWNQFQYTHETQSKFGDFVTKYPGMILKVPSVVIHQEFNYLINPHTSKSAIKMVDIVDLKMDSRLG